MGIPRFARSLEQVFQLDDVLIHPKVLGAVDPSFQWSPVSGGKETEKNNRQAGNPNSHGPKIPNDNGLVRRDCRPWHGSLNQANPRKRCEDGSAEVFWSERD